MHKDPQIKDFKNIEKKVNFQSVAAYYQIAKFYNFTELANLALCYIERCFATVCETDNFLQLDFVHVAQLLSSTKLHIDSEIQVYW